MKKKVFALLLTFNIIAVLTACGGINNYGADAGGFYPEAQFSMNTGGSTGSSASYGYDAAPQVMDDYMAEEYDFAIRSSSDIDGESVTSGAGSLPATDAAAMSEKIIYSAYADIETVDFDEAVDKVYEMLGVNNAFIENSYIGGRNYSQSYYGYQTYRTANFTLRVPKERFEAVTSSLEALGNVTSLRTDAQNITAQFYDTESRLSSFRIQEERLLAMLERSDTVTDMISIEARLAEIRYSIESLTSTLRNWQGQVDYSTLSIYIYEVEKYTESVPIQRTYWQQVGDGLSSQTKSVGVFFTDLFKWLIINLPVLVILAAIVIVIIVLVRRKIRKDRARQANRNPQMSPSMNMPYAQQNNPPMNAPNAQQNNQDMNQ